MQILGIIAVVLLVLAGLWLLRGQSSSSAAGGGKSDQIIDPGDSYQIGLLAGMTGGSIPDAAVLRSALQRFEQTHGRKATTRDMGTLAGMMKSAA